MISPQAAKTRYKSKLRLQALADAQHSSGQHSLRSNKGKQTILLHSLSFSLFVSSCSQILRQISFLPNCSCAYSSRYAFGCTAHDVPVRMACTVLWFNNVVVFVQEIFFGI